MASPVALKPSVRAALVDAAWVIMAAALLLLPAALWGRPFVFGDTIYYWGWGGNILDALAHPWPHPGQPWVHGRTLQGWGFATHDATPADLRFNLTWLTARSAFYAVPFRLLADLGGIWLVAALQALACAMLLKIMLQAVLPEASRLATMAIVAALAAVTSLGFEVGYVMPDLFGGLAVAAAAILVVFPARLGPAAKAFALALIVYAVVAHAENSLNMAVAAVLAVLLNRDLGWRSALVRAAPVALALAAGLIVAAAGSGVLSYAFGRPLHMPPFAAGRLIADGAAQSYLRQTCAGDRLAACDLADKPPAPIEHYLWIYPLEPPVTGSGLSAVRRVLAQDERLMRRHVTDAEAEQRERFVTEQPRLVLGAVMHGGAAQEAGEAVTSILVALTNFTVGADFDSAIFYAAGGPTILHSQLDALLPGGMEAGRYPFDLAGLIQRTAVLLSLVVLGVSVVRKDAKADPDLSRFVIFVLVMVIANAVLCGVISGPFARYQSRVEWLIPFLALASLARGFQSRLRR